MLFEGVKFVLSHRASAVDGTGGTCFNVYIDVVHSRNIVSGRVPKVLNSNRAGCVSEFDLKKKQSFFRE